jgi:hypothetical protein
MKKLNKEFESLGAKLNKAFATLTHERFQKFKRSFLTEIELDKLKKIKTDYQSDGSLLDTEKAALTAIENKLFDFLIELNEKNNKKETLVQNTKEILNRVMNSASHHGENPLYREELKDAIEKMKALKTHLN